MTRFLWFVTVVGSLVVGVAVGVLCMGNLESPRLIERTPGGAETYSGPEGAPTDELARRFMTGAGPFFVVAGVAFVAVMALDDLGSRAPSDRRSRD